MVPEAFQGQEWPPEPAKAGHCACTEPWQWAGATVRAPMKLMNATIGGDQHTDSIINRVSASGQKQTELIGAKGQIRLESAISPVRTRLEVISSTCIAAQT